MSILKDIEELVELGLISKTQGIDIQTYYEQKQQKAPNRLLIVFGLLGALLIGLGIILILAHNWDELPRSIKTVFGFLPMIIGQIACGYALFVKKNNILWREPASIFLFLGIGACIAIIGQVYHLPGNLSSFLFTWMLLALPLLYAMRSSAASLLYLIGITAFACQAGYDWGFRRTLSGNEFYYIPLFLLALPHYFMLLKESPNSNFTNFHHYFIPLSLLAALGSIAQGNYQVLFVAYCSLLGLFYLIGQLDFFKNQNTRKNSYLVLGSVGTIILLISKSFRDSWKTRWMEKYTPSLNELSSSPEFFAAVLISLLALGMLVFLLKNKSLKDRQGLSIVFLVFIPIFLLGTKMPQAFILVNLLLFVIGVLTIRAGAKKDHLGLLNYGLMIVSAVICFRFFDSDLSFVIRGLIFVLLGIGFFVTNYLIIQNRKKHGVTN